MAAPKAAAARGGNSNGNNQNSNQDVAQRAFAQFRQDMNNPDFRNRVTAMVPGEFRTPAYVDRLIESIFVAVRDNSKLLTDCDRASLFRAAERVAKRALTVGDNVAWLVPYLGQVEDQLGYKGAMILVNRSGIPIHIGCQAVFMNDPCKIKLGTDAGIEHSPYMEGDRGELRGCYAFAHHKTLKSIDVEWMPWNKINEIRMRAPSKNSPAWRDFPDEMGRKIPLKRICKRLPTERPIDLSDMDDRLGAQFDGVSTNVSVAAIAAPTDEPMQVHPAANAEKETVPVTVPAATASASGAAGGDDLFPMGG